MFGRGTSSFSLFRNRDGRMGSVYIVCKEMTSDDCRKRCDW